MDPWSPWICQFGVFCEIGVTQVRWVPEAGVLAHEYIWGCLSGAVGSVDVWCSAMRSCHGLGFESR